MSLPEVMLWKNLRGRSHDRPVFRRQHPFGPYILDFYCLYAKLAIEVDGASHGSENQPAHDARRDAWLKAQGVRVVRVPAIWVMKDAGAIAERSRVLAEAMIERRKSRQGA